MKDTSNCYNESSNDRKYIYLLHNIVSLNRIHGMNYLFINLGHNIVMYFTLNIPPLH